MRKIISSVLVLVMLVSIFNVSWVGLVQAASSDELVLLSTATQKAISNAVSTGEIDKKTIKNNKYSLKIAYKDHDGFTVNNVPEDISEYNEVKICVYATEAATGRFIISTENPLTEGDDYRSIRLDFTEGWQDISIELAKLGVSREPSYTNVSNISFSFNGW